MKKNIFGILVSLSLLAFTFQTRAQQSQTPDDVKGGADEIEGWIVKRTAKGIVKIPRKQKFRFEGSELEAEGATPPTTQFQPRLTPRQASLLPLRTSYKREIYESAGMKLRTKGDSAQ